MSEHDVSEYEEKWSEMTAGVRADWMRPLGSTGLTVSAVCVGGAPLGSVPEKYGYVVTEQEAVDFVAAVLSSPIRFIDTSNGYSEGKSEERIGAGVAQHGSLPGDFLIATKVDAKNGDYSRARVRESIRESSHRLQLGTLPLVYLHDPEYHDFGDLTGPGGAVETLVRMRDEGTIGHIGVAGGNVHVMKRYLDLGVFEVLLTHNRWTLIDRSAGELIRQAHAAGMGIVNAAIYGGGIIAKPRGGSTMYGYRRASRQTLEAVAHMADVCDRWNTDLATAALQASLRDARISSTVIGMSKVARLENVMTAQSAELPDDFWAEIGELLPSAENWLDRKSLS